MYKYAINTSDELTLCDCESNWNIEVGWTEEMYTGSLYNCVIVLCPYKDACLFDFDYETRGSKIITFNEARYLKRREYDILIKLRTKREPLLNAFDKYNISVTRGIIQETNSQKNEILEWYRKILDLDETAIDNPPDRIEYYL